MVRRGRGRIPIPHLVDKREREGGRVSQYIYLPHLVDKREGGWEGVPVPHLVDKREREREGGRVSQYIYLPHLIDEFGTVLHDPLDRDGCQGLVVRIRVSIGRQQ